MMRYLVGLFVLAVLVGGCGPAKDTVADPVKVQVTLTPEEKRVLDQYQALTPENRTEVDQFADKLTRRESREASMKHKLWIAGCGLGVLAAAAALLKLAGVL